MRCLLSLLSLLCVAHAAPPKAAVVYLTTARSKDIAELKQSLVHTYENFLSLYPHYPVLVVHEGDFTPALEAEVLAVVPQMVVRIVLEPHFEPQPHIAMAFYEYGVHTHSDEEHDDHAATMALSEAELKHSVGVHKAQV